MDRFLLGGRNGGSGQAMKIYVLLMLISVIVGFSYLSSRIPSKQVEPVPPDSLPA
jgi:hypothetical protein